MVKIIVPKGMVVFPGAFPGIAKNDINVVFEANPDEVAEMLVIAGFKDLIPQLEHIEDGKRVCYTRQGMRIELPLAEETEEIKKTEAGTKTASKAKTSKND